MCIMRRYPGTREVPTISNERPQRHEPCSQSRAGGSPEVDQDRRGFLTIATVATGAVGAVFAAVPFVASWKPSERARAAGAPVEVDVTKIEPGQMVTVTWRKKRDLCRAPHARDGRRSSADTTAN